MNANLEFIEDKKSYDPSKVKDKVLIDDHRLMHVGWHRLVAGQKWGDWNKEEIWNLHNRVVSEMKKRGFKHNIIDKKLDAIKLQELEIGQNVKDILTGLKTFVVSEEFISLVGSSAEGDAGAADVDFTIKLKSRNEEIENSLMAFPELKAISPDVHFIYDIGGSHGKHIAVYDLIAVKRGDLAVGNPQYSFPMFGAAPQTARIQDEHGLEMCYLHRDKKRCELVDVDGNRLINFPYLETEGAGMARPDTYILGGNLTTDGKFEVKDILRWNSTELIACPAKDRQFFLDKFEWTPNINRIKNKDEGLEFQERIILMQPFLPLKVRQGYGEYEFNTTDDLVRFWANGEFMKLGIAIQEKADGFRIVWHKKGNEVKGFTEDKKRDRADMLPTIRDEIKKLSPNELILDTEVVMYTSDGKPIPRHESMAVIASKTPITGNIKANIHDCLWYDGATKNDSPYSERIALARKAVPQDTKHLRVMPTEIAHTETELRAGIKKAAKTQGSEGAMLKVLNSPYPLNGRTPFWAKLKFVKEITLKVIGIRRKRAAGGAESVGTFLYRGAFLNKENKLEAMYSQHIIGPSDMQEENEWQMGQGFKNAVPGEYGYAETYASNVAAKLGDLITISPIHILKFTGKDGKERYATMFPRMRNLETAKTKPDTIEQLDKLAALGEGSSKMTLEEALDKIKSEDFPITIKEV